MCSSLALEPSLPCSIISFMLAQSLPLDSYLQERKKNARSVCITTVPEPQCSQRGEFHFPRASSPAMGYTRHEVAPRKLSHFTPDVLSGLTCS